MVNVVFASGIPVNKISLMGLLSTFKRNYHAFIAFKTLEIKMICIFFSQNDAAPDQELMASSK